MLFRTSLFIPILACSFLLNLSVMLAHKGMGDNTAGVGT